MIAVFRNRNVRSRYALVNIGPRGGIEYVKMEPRPLVVRRFTQKQLDLNWEQTSIDPKSTAERFLSHSAGTTNASEQWLRAIAFQPNEENQDANLPTE